MSLDHIKIECISTDLCQDCPELEVSVDHDMTVLNSFDQEVGVVYTNLVKCKHYRRCMRMIEYLKKKMPKEIIEDDDL